MSDPLTIGLHIDRSNAKQATDASKGDLASVEAAVLKMATSIEASLDKIGKLTRTQTTAMRAGFKALGDDSKTTFEVMEKAQEKVVAKSESLTSAFLKSNAAMKGIEFGVNLMKMYGEAVQEAHRYNEKITADLIKQRDAERELQYLRGGSSTGKTAIQSLQRAKKAGMTPEEWRQFESEFMNSGAQFVGQNMTKEQADQFADNIAAMSTTRGIEPGVMGDLAGRIMGQHDFSKDGKEGVGEATKRVGQVMAILSAGSGENASLLKQQTMAMAELLNEDSMKGSFQDPTQVATIISTMAEANPKEGATLARDAILGLRGFKSKQGDLLARSGITSESKPMESVEKLAAQVQKEVKERGHGVTPMDVLRENFESIEQAKGLAVLMNRGVGPNGTFAARARVVEGMDAEKVLGDIEAAKADPNGAFVQRQADASVRLAESQRAEERLKYKALYDQATAKMVQDGSIGGVQQTLRENILDPFNKYLFGKKTTRDENTEERMIEILARRNAAAGRPLGPEVFEELSANKGSMDNEQRFASAFARLEAAGGNPLADVKSAAKDMKAAADRMNNGVPKTMTLPTPGGGRAAVPR